MRYVYQSFLRNCLGVRARFFLQVYSTTGFGIGVCPFFFLIGCAIACATGLEGASGNNHKDKKILSLMRYNWSSAAKSSKSKKASLERARKLRALLTGKAGERGFTGRKGEQGEMGTQGPQGERGLKGEEGLCGEIGLQGEQGLQGETGPQGETGAEGEQGLQGEMGLRGERGHHGERGHRGEQGFRGEKGLIGEMGLQGEKGFKGDTGPKGEAGSQGLQGESGSRGERGLQGESGVSGPKGEMGPIGPKGEDGLRGDTGPTGPAGIWDTEGGELAVVFKPSGSMGDGSWQAIVITPSGKAHVTKVEEASTEDVRVVISPVELGLYTVCWKSNFESPDEALLLKEIEIDSEALNGDHIIYQGLPTSHPGEQRSISHVVVK